MLVAGAVAAPGPDADSRQPVVPLRHGQMIAEEREPLDQHVVPMREQLAPRAALRPVLVRLQQPEVGGAGVRPHVESPAIVVELVFVAPLPRQERRRRRIGIGRVEIPELGGEGLERPDQQVALRPARPHAAGKLGVGLLVDEPVGGRVVAEPVPQDPARTQRGRIVARVEERLAVGRPGEVGGHVRDDVRKVLSGGEIAHADGVPPAPDGVDGVGQQPSVRADGTRRHLAERMPLGHLVDVQDHLLAVRRGARLALLRGARGRPVGAGDPAVRRGAGPALVRQPPAAVNLVLAAVLVAAVVPVLSFAVRDRRVGLPDPPLDLLEQPLLEVGRAGQRLPEVGVLGLQIRPDLGVVALPQPVVLVDADVAVLLETVRAARSGGRFGSGQAGRATRSDGRFGGGHGIDRILRAAGRRGLRAST